MKLSKYLFTLLLTTLLCVLSFITINNYDTLKAKQYDFDRFLVNNGYDIQLYLFDIIEENIPDYQFIQINDKDEEPKEISYIYNELNNQIKNFGSLIKGDSNFQYIIKQNNKYISNEFNLKSNLLNKDYHLFYAHIQFDSNGNISCDNNNICSYFQENRLDNYIQAHYHDGVYSNSFNYWINEDKILFNNPKNIDLYILMPHKILPAGYIYHELTDCIDTYLIFTGIFALLALVILSIFVFFSPIEKLTRINPYKTIKDWLIEFNIILWGGIILLMGTATFLLFKYTLDGTIEYLLNESYSPSLFRILNFIVWLLFYYVLTILPFLIKYSLTYGIFNYLKEHTILGRCMIQFKHEISNIKIGYKFIILTILAFVIPAALGIGAIYLFAEVGVVLMVLGYIAMFILVLMIENNIYGQYKTLLDKTNQLSQGNFDIEINENVKFFEDYKKELLKVKDGFEKAVQEEVKSSNMKTELITNVSHDLKTPITCIKNYVTLLENKDLDKDTQKEYIHNLHQYTNRLTHLVEDLFEVSKVNSGNISLEPVELNIVDLVKQVLAENEDIFVNSNLCIVTKFEEEHITCELDGDKTYRIFENLITNIGKYALPHTRVYVDVIKFDHQVQIIFKNISKDEMNFTSEEIVERFVRGDKARHEQGSGLGLAIVKSYTEIQNGTFNISIDGDLFKAILTFQC